MARISMAPANLNSRWWMEQARATYWSNDGTSNAGSQPTGAVTLAVSKGFYAVLLGDTSVTNMTAIPATVFTHTDVRLRVWFYDGVTSFQTDDT